MNPPASYDIFCRVVDNFGDAGVCWRLARRLAHGHGRQVRIWIDDLATLHRLEPLVDPASPQQTVQGIEVLAWEQPVARAADIVLEGFGGGLPQHYEAHVFTEEQARLWIVLEYLSAEPWVREHHGLPSPHPRCRVPRYFYFPGFTADTGGLLHEPDLDAARMAFQRSGGAARYWSERGYACPPDDTCVVSLFAYETALWRDLLPAWEQSEKPVVVAVPDGALASRIAAAYGVEPVVGRSYGRGRLELRTVPFVPQRDYDQLLWVANCNFVRGEDSFVRAQWAGQPFVWQIYPQAEQAHWTKLHAFLALYGGSLPEPVRFALQSLWDQWNGVTSSGTWVQAWEAFAAHLPALRSHAADWPREAARAGELADKLAKFCADKL